MQDYAIQTDTLEAMKDELTRLGFDLTETELNPFTQVMANGGRAVAIYLGNIPKPTGETDEDENPIYEPEAKFSANIRSVGTLDIVAEQVTPNNPYNRFA